MYRFLLGRRWIGLALAVVLLVSAFVLLGRWQLHRLDERRAFNAVITANTAAAPRPAAALLAPGRGVPAGAEWSRVTARGRYDAAHQILVRYRPLDGEPGFHVLTPLVTAGGSAVLVNRGWIPGTGSAELPRAPKPPAGVVAVTGRVRPTEHADPGEGRPAGGQVRYVDVAQIAGTLPYPVAGGYVELVGQRPAPGDTPHLLPLPELSEGPHLAYAVQWFLFAAIAIGGVFFLAYDEAHGGDLRYRLRGPDRGGPARPRRRGPDRGAPAERRVAVDAGDHPGRASDPGRPSG